jgi:hypothetical protein
LSFYDADFSDVKQDKLERRFEQDLERARIEDMERVPTVVTPFAYSGQR